MMYLHTILESSSRMEVYMKNNRYPFVNLPLPYPYNALEPYIDKKTMHLHHDRHLQTYIDNLNALLKNHPRLQQLSLWQLITASGQLPKPLQTSVRNNAGGVYNHRFFFQGLTPSSQTPSGRLIEAIRCQFGSLVRFQASFKEAALSVFGSGYTWLVYDGQMLRLMTTPNQNCPIEQGLCPILTLDVWEHAYYLKHYNVRSAYIDDWMSIIDWEQAEKQFLSSQLSLSAPRFF